MNVGLIQAMPYVNTASAPRRLEAPQAAAGPTETVELQGAKVSAGSLLKSAGLAARNACLALLLGPVMHGVGKVLGALDRLPGPIEPHAPASPLADLPASVLERPVMFAHGWHTKMEFFTGLTDKLTEDGGNGGRPIFLQNGRCFSDPKCRHPIEPGPEARVFLSVLTSNRLSPDRAEPEIDANLKKIREITGQPVTDVLGYSMGGLCTRVHLDRREKDHGVGRFCMLGTPNQGAGLAGLAAHAMAQERSGWDVRWMLSPKDIQPEDQDALEWLRPGSIPRHDLNSRWSDQAARCEAVLHIGADTESTLGRYLWPGSGDKTVPACSLELEGLPMKWLPKDGIYSEHNNLPFHREVYMTLRDFFGWK